MGSTFDCCAMNDELEQLLQKLDSLSNLSTLHNWCVFLYAHLEYEADAIDEKEVSFAIYLLNIIL